ncbi:OmpA family protein [Nioella sp.]|uniref:OmpA family protein n=1 Tax=Nioella sp. TaxID=1912091 RepID=UPI003B529122
MKFLATALFGLFAMSAVAMACPTFNQTGASHTLTGQQLYSPQSYSVVAGGQNPLQNCGFSNFGYVTTAPDFSFYLSGMDQYYLVADVVSQCDAVLLVNTANASWLFDDDSNGNLDPRIEIRGAANLNGRVDVWVGTYDGSYCNATLNMETWLAQAPAPQPQPQPQPQANCPSYAYTGQEVSLTGQQLYTPQRYNVNAGGPTPLATCPSGGLGYAYAVPHYSFYLSGMEGYQRLEIEVEGQCDTTLLVNTPSTQWYFDDDSRGNLQPLLNLASSDALNGRLDVWVGTYDGATCLGVLELETWEPVNVAPPAPPSMALPDGYFRLTTMFREGFSECLEGNQAASGPAFMDRCQNVTGQLWRAMPVDGGYYRLTTAFREGANECLEGNQINGAAMNGAAFMDSCQDVSGQLWRAVPAGDGYFRLTTMFRENAGECLEGNQANGATLNGAAFMDMCQDVSGQYWRAIPAELVQQVDIDATAEVIQGQLETAGMTNLPINFEFDSATLTPQARALVARLAQAIFDAGLSGRAFEVQGHTDASGAASYNLDLSNRRAQAVIEELVNVHGINRALLTPVGYGETRLINPSSPNAAENRRVEILLR